VPDCGAAELAAGKVVAPGDDMGTGLRCGAEFFRPVDAGEAHEVADRVFVRSAGAPVADIGEPLDLGGHIREAVKRGGG
jgi:hypothetical protein